MRLLALEGWNGLNDHTDPTILGGGGRWCLGSDNGWTANELRRSGTGAQDITRGGWYNSTRSCRGGWVSCGRRTKRRSNTNSARLRRRSVLSGFFDDGTLFFLIFGENLHEVVWDGFVQLVADRSENSDTKNR